MPVNFSEFMKKMGTLNAYTPGATTNSSNPNSLIEIAKPGGTGTTRPPVKPNPAAPTPTRAGSVPEREVYDDSKNFNQQKLDLEAAKLSASSSLANTELAIKRQGQAASIEGSKADRRQKERNDTWAYTLANRELHARKVESARNAANNKAQIGVQASKVAADREVGLADIKSGERVNMAQNATTKYGIDTGFKTAKMTDSTTRLRDRQNFDLGKLTLASNERIKSADRIVQERTGRNSNLTSVIASWGV